MLTSMYVERDSYKLNIESQRKLDSLVQLKNNLKFRIFGNCDISGTNEYNKVLSEKRTNAVNAYLKNKIGSNIILESAVGLGEEKPINDNSTDERRGKNRRVDDIFIDEIFTEGEIKSRAVFASFFSRKVSDMKIGETFSLPNVNFVVGRHIWLPSAEKNLRKLFLF
jgi:hypothetical protein